MKLELSRRRARIEMIPLIDVVFLLLTAFIYTAVTMVVARGIEIELPQASTGERLEEERLTVIVGADGRAYIEEEPVSIEELVERAGEFLKEHPAGGVYIRGDRAAELGLAIRVLDALRSAGAERVTFEVSTRGVSTRGVSTRGVSPVE